MNWKFWQRKAKQTGVPRMENPPAPPTPKNLIYIGDGRVGFNPILDDTFDGEKTPGELGSVYDTKPDHLRLRLRAYDLNLKTDIIKVITGKFFKWVVGTGLKLQSEPSKEVLEIFNINLDVSKFKKRTEALFDLYAKSTYSDYHGRDWLHKKAQEAFKTAFLGGDALCVIRFGEHGPNVQVIDGQQVQTPFDDKGKGEGNVIHKGVEVNKKGEHIAFWVAVDSEETGIVKHQRIEAKNKNKNVVAWMVYGTKERIDHYRGIPMISSILEKVSKLDRFVEASVKKAEETANVVYAFEHNEDSTGENILTQSLSSKRTDGTSEETAFEQTGRTAAMMRQSTSSMVLNLTPGSKLVNLHSQSETTFNEFFRAVFSTLCASVDIPEEVALQKYEQNYSSSRAAINGWEHIVEIYRQDIVSKKFYEPFYRAWLEWQILNGLIDAPMFIQSKTSKEVMIVEAYCNARFTGKKMPHIDPLKEAKAVRAMIGDDNVAFISYEQATEMLGAGDWESNYTKYLEERDLVPDEIKNQNDTNQDNQQQSGMGESSES